MQYFGCMKTPIPETEAGPPTCPNCVRLQAQIQALQERMAALEGELRRGKRQATPFSKEQPKKEKKHPGRTPGKGRFHFQQPPTEEQIQETLHGPLPACPACGGWLTERREHEHFQVDLPEITPLWRRFVTQSGSCEHCRRRVHARHPEQISAAAGAAGVSVGPRAKALASDLKHRLGVPWRKITDLYSVAFGLKLSASALYQADVRLAARLDVVYAELARTLRQAAQVHADETGWRIGLLPCWLWVFAHAQVSVYAISDRSHQVVLRVLGREFRGVLTSDCFTAYDARALREWVQQKCLAHLIRAASELDQNKTKGRRALPPGRGGALPRCTRTRARAREVGGGGLRQTARRNRGAAGSADRGAEAPHGPRQCPPGQAAAKTEATSPELPRGCARRAGGDEQPGRTHAPTGRDHPQDRRL
jgi:hypothetical protein